MSAISIGCWTCRVRHKKCDITIPSCRECSDRNVRCHGYGPKPAWMDGGCEEKKERERIKAAINQHVRRIRKLQNRTRIVSSQTYEEEHPSTAEDDVSTAFDTGDNSVAVPSASLEIKEQPYVQDGGFDPQAACLLMHYLDQVFAWQFPYFCSTSRLGNRGWLLYLLLKRGPLYYAVLSLSSLHQSAVMGSEEEYQQKERALEHHSRALREFCKFMGEERGKLLDDNARLAEFLACSLILISCQVFRGAEHDWLLHLDAVISVIQSLSPETIFDARYTSHTGSSGHQNRQQEGLEFLLAAMVSLDLFACLPTGRVPRLPYQKWLHTAGIQIADLLSCENWIMIVIGDLACFGEWKEVQERDGILSIDELVKRGEEIKDRLTTGIEKLDLSRDEQEDDESQTNWVTRLFALACLVLLHTIVSGPLPALPEIQSAVSRSIIVLQNRPRVYSLTGLVWALCVLGCMAQPQNQRLFENLMADVVRDSARFGNCGTVLKILRNCWKMQETGRADCRITMSKMGICAILI